MTPIELNKFLNLGLDIPEGTEDSAAFDLIKNAAVEQKLMTLETAKKDKDLSKHFYEQDRITFKEVLKKTFDIDLKSIEGISDAVKAVKVKIDADIDSAIQAAKSKTGDTSKEVEAIQAKYNELLNENSILKQGVETYKSEIETIKTDYSKKELNAIKNSKLSEVWETAKSKLSDTKDVIWLEGFKSQINSKYQLDLDESKVNLIVMDKDGNLIPSKENIGAKMQPLEIILSELEAAGGLKKNNAGGTPPSIYTPLRTVAGAETERALHPNIR